MNRIISLFLFIFVTSCLNAQYNSPVKNKLTLGKQTTADGLIFRGNAADTATATLKIPKINKQDTSAYLLLDTINNVLLKYNISTTYWTRLNILPTDTASMLTPYFRDADTISLNLNSRFATKLNISDTASMLTNYLRTGVSASTYLPLSGGTLTGVLNGTTGTFTGLNINNTTTEGIFTLQGYDNNTATRIQFKTTGSIRRQIVLPTSDSNLEFRTSTIGGTQGGYSFYTRRNPNAENLAFNIDVDGNSNFYGTLGVSSNITANSFIKSSGTSTQFLKADGSVDGTSYLPLTGGTLSGSILNSWASAYSSAPRNDGAVRSTYTQNLRSANGGNTDRVTHYYTFSSDECCAGSPVTMYYGRFNGFYNQANIIYDASIYYHNNNQFYYRAFSESENKVTFSIKPSTTVNSIIGTKADLYLSGDAQIDRSLNIGTTLSVSSNITANSFIKSSGTSTEFLKANGSVDNNTYLTTGTAASTYQTILTNPVTGTGTNEFISKFTSTGSTIGNSVIQESSGNIGIGITPTSSLELAKGKFITLNSRDNTGQDSSGIMFYETSTKSATDINFGAKIMYDAVSDNFEIKMKNYNGTSLFNPPVSISIPRGTGNVNIGTSLAVTGNISANSFIKSSGTSSEFLKADGSVDNNTYLTTGTASSTYLPLAGGTLTGTLNGINQNLNSNLSITDPIPGNAPRIYTSVTTGPSTTAAIRLALDQSTTGGANMFLGGSQLAGGNSTNPNIFFADSRQAYASVQGIYTGAGITSSGHIVFNTTPNDGTTALTERMRIAQDGAITMGGTLGVIGSSTFSSLAGTGSRAVVADVNGVLSAPVSSINYKENVQSLNYGLKEILKINPVSFEYIDKNKWGEEKNLGFIVEDVFPIIPEVTGTMQNNDLYLDMVKLIPILTKAIQEQNALIKTLEQRIIILENK